jgi:fermentation-respiration switch protein FrsA (DUF1100 family)
MTRLLTTLLLYTCSTLAQAHALLSEPTRLQTATGTLHGTLLLPHSEQPQPVALLIAGSGPTDRNGNNPLGGNNDALRLLAQSLARMGVASLRYDKRGIAASRAAEPDEEDLSVEGYVADAVSWAGQLRRDPRFSRLILIGHSEGALIASLAALQANADAMISIAGSARPIDQVLHEQLSVRLPPEALAISDALIEELRQGRTVSDVPEGLQALFRPSVQPYLISLFRQDPAAAFAATRMPALILQGSHDIQVGVQDARLLQQARPDAQSLVIPGMNHVLRIVPADIETQLASYNDPKRPLAAALSNAIQAFLRDAGILPASSPASDGR